MFIYHDPFILALIEAVLIDFSLAVKAATLIFISGRGSTISSAKKGKSGSIYIYRQTLWTQIRLLL